MKKIFKKFGLSLAALACVTCAGVGVVMSSSNSASEVQADIAASDYYVSGAGVRLVNDANGTGLRFHTNISVAEYGEILSSGTLIIPEVRCDGNLTLDDLNNSDVKTRPVHVVTKGEDKNGNPVDLWYDTTVGDTPMKKSTVYLYNIPESSYGARMVAVSYVTTGEGTFYTPTAPNTSISDVAKSALNNASLTDAQKAQVSPYVVDEVTVTYNMPNGSTQTEKVAYGSQLSGPTYNTDTYVLSGATDQYGNQINFADYEATLPVNLDVVLATKTTVVTQWIKDCYAATAVERAFVNGSTATTVTEGIPNGYSSVLKLDWYSGSTAMWDLDNGNRDLYRVCFDNTDLSSYDKVTFAMKLETNGDAYIATKNGGTNFGANVWLYFELVQTSANVWTVTITNTAGEILYTTEGLVRNSNGFNKNVDSIGPLLFCAYSTTADAPKLVVRCPSSTTDMTASIYMTEVIGYVNVPDFDPEISEDAEILWNHVWNAYYFTGGAGAEGAYSEEAAPDGYSYVSEYSFVGGDFPKTGHLNNSDVSDYSDLYFA
ncbi:MAG: hypothetical protein IJY21_03875, partial [Clostridia bacterium]|nr:hypothetical protein [Clostridia bacterium]